MINEATAIGPQSHISSCTEVDIQNPELEIERTMDFDRNDVYTDSEIDVLYNIANWRVVITNTGDMLLLGVQFSDSNAAILIPEFDLAVGATRTINYTTIPASDLVNTVVAQVESLEPTLDTTEVITILPFTPEADISISKTVDYNGDGFYNKSETGIEGDTVYWRIIITNIGDVDFMELVFSNNNAKIAPVMFDLKIGKSQVFSYSTVLKKDTVNTVTASGAQIDAKQDTARLEVEKFLPYTEPELFLTFMEERTERHWRCLP